MELIRDISNELDINVLCHKILVNVGLLTQADRGSLFLAKGTTKNRYLVAKLFDVTQDIGKWRKFFNHFIYVDNRLRYAKQILKQNKQSSESIILYISFYTGKKCSS